MVIFSPKTTFQSCNGGERFQQYRRVTLRKKSVTLLQVRNLGKTDQPTIAPSRTIGDEILQPSLAVQTDSQRRTQPKLRFGHFADGVIQAVGLWQRGTRHIGRCRFLSQHSLRDMLIGQDFHAALAQES